MSYKSVTFWKAVDYLVKVQTGSFASRGHAELFGRQPMWLVRDGSRLALVSLKTGIELEEAYDADVTVLRLKTTAQHKRTAELADYEPVDIRIRNFAKYPEFAQFDAVDYAVIVSPQPASVESVLAHGEQP